MMRERLPHTGTGEEGGGGGDSENRAHSKTSETMRSRSATYM